MHRAAWLGLLLTLGGGAASASDSNPWTALEKLRSALAAESPLRARFVQTYLPAGFSSGEEEEGWFAVALPDCLRWDYQEPYPKAFLLCRKTIHYWNQDEHTGQRYTVRSEEEPGLDFFLLTIEDLRVRYNAAAEAGPKGSLWIRLLPIRPSDNLVEANVRLDRSRRRLQTLEYRDVEGNMTRFEIENYERGADPQLFIPPAEVEWEER